MKGYGPSAKWVKRQMFLAWPLIKAGKKLSNAPLLKWLIHPFFARPHNELTAIPIHQRITDPEYSPIPLEILEQLVSEMEDVFIMNRCQCADLKNPLSTRLSIGCMALGPGIRRIHPSNGRVAGPGDAAAHVRKAADHGLVANIAHVWIDALAFQIPDFKHLLFICFCDDDHCIYRTHMKHPGPGLAEAFKRLPGIRIVTDQDRCTGCGTCRDQCFAAAVKIIRGKAVIFDRCKGCGLCIRACPANALSLSTQSRDRVLAQLRDRVKQISGLG